MINMARIAKGDYVTGGEGFPWKTPVKVLRVHREASGTFYSVISPTGILKTFSPSKASRIRKCKAPK